ncbi:39S ribosomal protein L50, mitochondrial [Eumeta japonica]|uniref:Large ribosomal subunit protein mL50 n=1 Tax=Eumeta variegata TaxID=151549 RepID=A0A4C1TT07_EUMVA|nr:39S ribosomal protein L50, mitochondrial [Eumeta japonica]
MADRKQQAKPIVLPQLARKRKQCSNYVISIRRFATKKLPKVDKKLQAAAESLTARGFLRPSKPYDPPLDAEQKVLNICASNGLSTDFDTSFQELDKKFAVLNACFNELNYSVPNSLLHTIVSVGDLVTFYKTPVDTNTPFDALKTLNLPKNLHVQPDYIRFHPDAPSFEEHLSRRSRMLSSRWWSLAVLISRWDCLEDLSPSPSVRHKKVVKERISSGVIKT